MNFYALCMIFAAGSLLTLLCVAIYPRPWDAMCDRVDREVDAAMLEQPK